METIVYLGIETYRRYLSVLRTTGTSVIMYTHRIKYYTWNTFSGGWSPSSFRTTADMVDRHVRSLSNDKKIKEITVELI